MEKTLTTTYQPVQHAPIECPYCGAFFSPKNKRRKYCYDAACHREHRRLEMRDYVERYKAEHGHTPTQKYRPAGTPRAPRKMHTNTCKQCGSAYQTKDRRTYLCSPTCIGQWNSTTRTRKTTDIVPYVKLRVYIPQHTQGRGFTQGPCAECGTEFTGVGMAATYCSALCSSRASWAKRLRASGGRTREEWAAIDRACTECEATYNSPHPLATTCSPRCRRASRRVSKWISDTRRQSIYERDNYECHICGQVTDPNAHHLNDWYPTLDHLTPVAQGGADESSNLATCHRWCNSVRGISNVREAREKLGVPQA